MRPDPAVDRSRQVARAADSRALVFAECGDLDGSPVFALHGTPSCRGFDPATISVETQIWYGTQDVLTPPGHGEWLARTVPGAIVRRTGPGHFGDPDADTVERLTWLAAGSR
jgi:hypothetical protein